MDKSDCGKLYLCEIAATPEPERLTEDTKTLHLLRQTYNKVGGQSNYQIISKFLPWNRDWSRRVESNLTWLGKSGWNLVLMCAGKNLENVQSEALLVLSNTEQLQLTMWTIRGTRQRYQITQSDTYSDWAFVGFWVNINCKLFAISNWIKFGIYILHSLRLY